MDETPEKVLSLDLVTIQALNEYLAAMIGSTPLDKFHGSLTIRIVKGQFAAIECAASYLLPDKKKQSRKTA